MSTTAKETNRKVGSDQAGNQSVESNSHHPQVIIGSPPAKSNGYRIIILKNKDKTKQHASLAKSQELKAYETSFQYQCQYYRNAHINVPFEIEIDCYFKNKQSDLDNALKVVLDCLQSINAISNDNLCDRIVIDKHVDPSNPRIEFTLRAKEGLKPWVTKVKGVKKVPKVKPAFTLNPIINEPII